MLKNHARLLKCDETAEICINNLQKHGFKADFVSSSEKARLKIQEIFAPFQTFGFGGSDTTRQLNLIDDLKAAGKTVFDHWHENLSKDQDLEIRLAQGRCDCFICSANAIAATGEIINVDGIGNRTNAMTFGTRKVVIVAGMNKVTLDLASALKRVREVAGPMRAKSLNMETPCNKTGICSDCNSPQRICRITTILHRCPMLSDVSVVLINEALGY